MVYKRGGKYLYDVRRFTRNRDVQNAAIGLIFLKKHRMPNFPTIMEELQSAEAGLRDISVWGCKETTIIKTDAEAWRQAVVLILCVMTWVRKGKLLPSSLAYQFQHEQDLDAFAVSMFWWGWKMRLLLQQRMKPYYWYTGNGWLCKDVDYW